jgi:ribosomal protein L30/L7E
VALPKADVNEVTMNLKYKKRIELLALAYTPKTGNSIRDWRPFGEDDLNTIITNYNKGCLERYKKTKCLHECIENCMEVIHIVGKDLSTVHELNSQDFAGIHIILIDLDAIGEIEERTLDQIKVCLPKDHVVSLPQVSRTPSATSYATYFVPLLVKPSMPEILENQVTFEVWLYEEICGLVQTRYIVVTAPPPDGIRDDPAALRLYRKTLPGVADKVRESAIMRDLSEEETIALAHKASMQEIALTRIAEQVHTRTNRDVVLDAIREPVVGMPIELGFQSPALRQANLVELHVTQPIHELTTEQRNAVVGLGIKEWNYAAVHLDQPTTWEMVRGLKDVVKTTKFSAELSVGSMGKGNL